MDALTFGSEDLCAGATGRWTLTISISHKLQLEFNIFLIFISMELNYFGLPGKYELI